MLGDGGFWINGSTGIESLSGSMDICYTETSISIRNIQISFIWYDQIDAKSFIESSDDMMENLIKGEDGETSLRGFLINIIEGYVDLTADKIIDLDYIVEIPMIYVNERGSTGIAR